MVYNGFNNHKNFFTRNSYFNRGKKENVKKNFYVMDLLYFMATGR